MNAHAPLAPPLADAPFVIVINAGSGRGDADEARRAIAGVLDAAGRRHTFVEISDSADIEATVAEAAGQVQASAGVLVAAGGDGTLNAVARRALADDLPYAVLPQGTFNLFGREHGIPLEAAASARALLRARPSPVQVGQVNGRPFLVNASLGLYPELLERREEDKQRFGRHRAVAYFSGLLTLLRERVQLELDIEGEGGSRRVCTPSLFVGNNRLQLDMVGIDDADPQRDHRLTGVLVKPCGWLSLLWLGLRGALGKLGDAENIETFEFRRLTVTPRGRARCKVALDGEILQMEAPLVFEVSPRPLRLLLPAPADRVAPA